MSASDALRHALGCCLAGMILSGCGSGSPTAAAIKPVKADPVAHESELLRLTLTPDAVRRLGLQTSSAESGDVRTLRNVQGEIVAAPVGGGLPVGATTDLATLSASQSRADSDVARMRAELQSAEKAFARAEALVREEAGSLRSLEEAESARAVARANLSAAEAQRLQLGPQISSRPGGGALWVRAAVFAADVDRVDRTQPAEAIPLGGDSGARQARPVRGPPTANPAAGTVDLYYALAGNGAPLRIGQRVSVRVPLVENTRSLLVPASAILRDIHGGEWVYVQVAPGSYERRRVDVTTIRGAQAHLARGLAVGAPVVTAGAMELFGAEFGAK